MKQITLNFIENIQEFVALVKKGTLPREIDALAPTLTNHVMKLD